MSSRIWLLLTAVTLLAWPAAAQRGDLFVSAAVSLTDVLQPLVAVYEKRTGTRVIVNLGASNALARQIAAGAPVDLFISADERQMDGIRDHLLPGSRVALLSNRLAIAVRSDRQLPFRSVRDLTGPSFRRIAIGDPAAVPAGVYTKQYLETLGLWSVLQPKVVPSGSVRLALAAVENGVADAAVVYRTDLHAARGVRLAHVVPAEEGPRIVYPAAVIRSSRRTVEATRLLAFLRSDEASGMFSRAGFLPLSRAD